jgi:cytochrome c556
MRNMVPEWASYYPAGPVEELGAAVEAGDRGAVMSAFGEVGKTCHHCHLATMAQVQQRYHWGDFGAVRVEDPLTHEVTDYSIFKKYLSTNLTGIRVDLRQGQRENAIRQFEGFKARFQRLKESCQYCHEEGKQDYVGDEARRLLEKLERALADPGVPSEAMAVQVQNIGRESCSRCHRVHVPAAIARAASR